MSLKQGWATFLAARKDFENLFSIFARKEKIILFSQNRKQKIFYFSFLAKIEKRFSKKNIFSKSFFDFSKKDYFFKIFFRFSEKRLFFQNLFSKKREKIFKIFSRFEKIEKRFSKSFLAARKEFQIFSRSEKRISNLFSIFLRFPIIDM